MNILILTDKYPPDVGGLAISTRRLAHGLAQAQLSVCVSAPGDAVPPGSIVELDDGWPVFRIGPQRRADDSLSAWHDHVVALHAAHRFDIIHAMYIASPAFVAVAAARYLGLPSVISARGNDLERSAFDPARFAQVSWALQHASAVTAVTHDLARKARAFAPGREVQLVPNGVDSTLFSPGPRDEALANRLQLGDAPLIAFVGEARQKKGLAILLLAFARLCAQRDPRPSLLLIGGVRKDDAPIVHVFQKQNPTLDVRLLPNLAHAELPAYYRLADIVALPSLHDGLPNALLEAMACGKAVVGSNAGGIPDVLRDGQNGRLVPPGDADALANALAELLDDPARRAELGRAAQASVESDWTPEREIERNIDIYCQLCNTQ